MPPENREIQVPQAANLQSGLVTGIGDDPEGEYRVQIDLPLLQASGVWARIGCFYASNGVGALFCPEVGDEVLVGFINGDPGSPVILGSLYSQRKTPPIPPEANNDRKTIVTRSKVRIDFFDGADPAVEIATPGGHSIRLDDGAQAVTIKDSGGNRVTMARDGVTVDSASKLTLNASGDIAVSALGKVSIAGNLGVALSGMTITADADGSFSAQGSAEAKLTSSGMTTVQGGLVKIN